MVGLVGNRSEIVSKGFWKSEGDRLGIDLSFHGVPFRLVSDGGSWVMAKTSAARRVFCFARSWIAVSVVFARLIDCWILWILLNRTRAEAPRRKDSSRSSGSDWCCLKVFIGLGHSASLRSAEPHFVRVYLVRYLDLLGKGFGAGHNSVF